MTKLYAKNILIGSEWQSDITLEVNQAGNIENITNGRQSGALTLKGPVIPGMVNCHSHAFQRAFAGFSEYRANQKDSFWSWRDIMYRFVAGMTPDDVFNVARFAYIEMLKAGYTSVAEFHYLHHDSNGHTYDNPAELSNQIIHASTDTSIDLTHLPVLYSYAGFGKQKPSNAQGRFIHTSESFISLIEQISKQKHQATYQLGIAPHSLRAVSKDQLDLVVPIVNKILPGAPIHIHIAEQMAEVEDCVNYYGKRPVEWLFENLKIDERWCLVHATHLSDKEQTDLAKSRAVAGICPLTEANLGDGIFPTQTHLRGGGRLAIGSDSHISINVADELRSLEYAQRLTCQQRAVLVSDECPSVGQYLYTKAAHDGAQAVAQNVGEIAAGKRANLIELDQNHPSLIGKNGSQILDAAIFACPSLPVYSVIVGGKLVVEGGRHNEQETALCAYKKTVERILAKVA